MLPYSMASVKTSVNQAFPRNHHRFVYFNQNRTPDSATEVPVRRPPHSSQDLIAVADSGHLSLYGVFWNSTWKAVTKRVRAQCSEAGASTYIRSRLQTPATAIPTTLQHGTFLERIPSLWITYIATI